VKSEAQAAGLSANVDPSLASIEMDYQLKWSRSTIDFLHELSELVGGTLKLGGGQLLVMKRGSGTSAGGQALPPILIQKTQGYGYNCMLEPRPQHGKIAGAYIDKNGQRQLAQVPTGLDGTVYVLPHPYKSQTEAQNAAKAEAYERGNNTFSGTFESPGLPNARAEAPVTLSGFGWPIDGPCKAEHVKSKVGNDGSYMTTVEVKSGNADKGKGKS
jgi:phage protein D